MPKYCFQGTASSSLAHADLRNFEMPLLVELASNALGDNVLVGPLAAAEGRGLSELVAGVEHTSGPASPAEVDVGVLVHGIELLAESLQTAGLAGAAGLGEDSLALVLLEPCTESLKDVDVVGGASGVGARSVGVKVLVHVEDEVGGAAVLHDDYASFAIRVQRVGIGEELARDTAVDWELAISRELEHSPAIVSRVELVYKLPHSKLRT